MYGLFTAVCAFGLLQFDTINRRQKCSWRFLFINSLIHAAIILTHLYGVFYSAAILVAFIARDTYFRMFRKNVYLSVLAGWIVLVPLSPIIIDQSKLPAKWFQVLSLPQVIDTLTPFPRFTWFILALILISILLYVTEAKDEVEMAYRNKSKFTYEISLLMFAVSFMLVPVAAWVITVALKPLLVDRYIIPTVTLSWAIFLVYFTSLIIPDFKADGRPTKFTKIPGLLSFNPRAGMLSILTLTILLSPIYYAKKLVAYSQKPGVNDFSYGYAELPIALEAGHDFLPRFYYSSKPSRYFHILDWESASFKGDYVAMGDLSRNYPFIQSIQSTDFLQQHSRFLVLNQEDQKWFETRIENNPDYQIKKLGIQQGAFWPLTMFLVERRR